MQDEALIKKIQKLMALATSPNENEANVAAQKAQELIAKYNIDMQQLNQDFEYQWHELSVDPYYKMHQKFIVPLLEEYFFVKTLSVSQFTGTYTVTNARQFRYVLKIMGTPTNVIIADYVYHYLCEAFQKLWLVRKKKDGLNERQRQGYYNGLTKALEEKLTIVRENAVKSAAEEMVRKSEEAFKEGKIDRVLRLEDATALTVIRKDLALDKAYHSIGKIKVSKSSFSNNSQAEAAGREDGKNINLSRPVDHKSSAPVLGIGLRK